MKFRTLTSIKEDRLSRFDLPADLAGDNEVADAILGVPCHFADITVTAASVSLVSGNTSTSTAGEAITQGQALYYDTSATKWYKADANASGKDVCTGIALTSAAADGQPIVVQTSGIINIGATVAIGTVYVVSATAGGIAPSTDLASGHKTCVIGVATTTGRLKLGFLAAEVAVP